MSWQYQRLSNNFVFPIFLHYFKTWKTTKFSMYSVLAAKCQISINWKKSCWNSLNWMERSIPYHHLIQDCFFGIISGIFHTHKIFQKIKAKILWGIEKSGKTETASNRSSRKFRVDYSYHYFKINSFFFCIFLRNDLFLRLKIARRITISEEISRPIDWKRSQFCGIS